MSPSKQKELNKPQTLNLFDGCKFRKHCFDNFFDFHRFFSPKQIVDEDFMLQDWFVETTERIPNPNPLACLELSAIDVDDAWTNLPMPGLPVEFHFGQKDESFHV